MSYCQVAKTNPLHKYYHDKEYGFPVVRDDLLFERLALEINQAGLSWDLMLKKRAGFNQAFHKFNVEKVARMTERDIAQLLIDEGIIRNRKKIEAVIANAQIIIGLKKKGQSFVKWLAIQSKENSTEREWVKTFKKAGFKFIGEEIMKEFLQSVGYLPAPHDILCPVNKEIFKTKVLNIVKGIPKGKTMTYGEVAAKAGNPNAARAVGALMSRNQDKKIPCHRVVGKNGYMGGYNGLQGNDKRAILRREGVVI